MLLTLSDSNSTLNVAGVANLADISVNAAAGTLNFAVLNSLTRTSLSATGGGKLLFPAAATYVSNNNANYTIQASGSGQDRPP